MTSVLFSAMQGKFTRAQKKLMRAYALQKERAKGENVMRVRFLRSGDVRAYCKDGHTYLIAPVTELCTEAYSTAMLNWLHANFTIA